MTTKTMLLPLSDETKLSLEELDVLIGEREGTLGSLLSSTKLMEFPKEISEKIQKKLGKHIALIEENQISKEYGETLAEKLIKLTDEGKQKWTKIPWKLQPYSYYKMFPYPTTMLVEFGEDAEDDIATINKQKIPGIAYSRNYAYQTSLKNGLNVFITKFEYVDDEPIDLEDVNTNYGMYLVDGFNHLVYSFEVCRDYNREHLLAHLTLSNLYESVSDIYDEFRISRNLYSNN